MKQMTNDKLGGRRFLRRSTQAFSLIEILIALFVFLVGVMGVLSIFPVAMHSAGRSTGEVRSTILAQNVIAQMNADCQAAFERGVCSEDGSMYELKRTGGSSRSGYFVTLTSGLGKGQSRLIYSDVGTTMQVVPGWTEVPNKDDGYIVTRLGLPWDDTSDIRRRYGYVRRIDGDTIYAGMVDAGDPLQVAALTGADWLLTGRTWEPPAAIGGSITAADGSGLSIEGVSGTAWTLTDDAYRGKLVRITLEGTTAKPGQSVGQVRWITQKNGDTLDVYPSWAAEPVWSQDVKFEIYDTLGYFLVITSGRASGRIFPITDFVGDSAGDKITCDGVDFSDLRVKGGTSLSNADSFAIIGGTSTILTAFPVVSWTSDNPSYVFNSFGWRNTVERQAGQDLFKRDDSEKEASDFDCVGILTPPDGENRPVRVDVFVFRNYDSAKSPKDNQRALGYMTGYIGRPKP